MIRNFAAVLLSASILLISGGCGITGNAGSSSDEDKELVSIAVQEGNMTIEVTRIIPMGMPPRITHDGYKLSIKDGVVNADLPFIGTSRIATGYGTEPAGIVFKDAQVRIYVDDSKASKGRHCWSFEAKSGSDPVRVSITFWDNGTAQIDCVSTNRSTMGYSGNLIPEN